jgi:hypothetical protein
MRKKMMVSLLGMFLLLAGMGLAQEGYIHISPYAWNTYDSGQAFWALGGSSGSTCFLRKTVAADYVLTPVYFPPEADGLLVRQVTVSFYDNEASEYIGFALRKVDLYDQGATTVASIDTGGNSASWRRMYINRWDMSARRIDNERYAWYIAIYFSVENSSDLRLGNIKIKYATD